jgi:hypothetical protein
MPELRKKKPAHKNLNAQPNAKTLDAVKELPVDQNKGEVGRIAQELRKAQGRETSVYKKLFQKYDQECGCLRTQNEYIQEKLHHVEKTAERHIHRVQVENVALKQKAEEKGFLFILNTLGGIILAIAALSDSVEGTTWSSIRPCLIVFGLACVLAHFLHLLYHFIRYNLGWESINLKVILPYTDISDGRNKQEQDTDNSTE